MNDTLAYILSAASVLIAGSVVALVAHVRREIDSRTASSSLSLLTLYAGTLVLAAMDEVRTLKAKPGAWTAADASRVKNRVLDELRALGAHDIQTLTSVQGLTEVSVSNLLDKLIEEQVEILRAQAKPASMVNVLVPSPEAETPAAQ